jgi:hypothetical protein
VQLVVGLFLFFLEKYILVVVSRSYKNTKPRIRTIDQRAEIKIVERSFIFLVPEHRWGRGSGIPSLSNVRILSVAKGFDGSSKKRMSVLQLDFCVKVQVDRTDYIFLQMPNGSRLF